jgi:hypothetical protein
MPQSKTLDVTGQPGGPSPEIQAQVDAEQAALIERIKAERAPIEAAARAAIQQRMDKAAAAQSGRADLVKMIEDLTRRVAALETKQ